MTEHKGAAPPPLLLLLLSPLLMLLVRAPAAQAWMPAPQSISVGDLSQEQAKLIQRIWTGIFFSVPGTEKNVLLQAAKASGSPSTGAPLDTSNITQILLAIAESMKAGSEVAGAVQPLPVDHVSMEDRLWSAYNKEIERYITETGGSTARTASYPQVNSHHLKLMLENVFHYVRSDEMDPELKGAIRMYITRKLYSYNMISLNHVFQFKPTDLAVLAEALDVQQNLDAALEVQDPEEPVGVNVVGVLPGRRWGTADDRVIIVGAHYDTVPQSPGLDDNGSGVVAMLETARTLYENGCQPEFSLLFVAFDLEETGGAGSLAFIHQFLNTKVLAPAGWPAVQGAFILDTIMNYNASVSAQTVPFPWMEQLPSTVNRIDQSDGRGDFLAAIYRRPVEQHLVDAYGYHYSRLGGSDRFRLEEFDVDLPAERPDDDVLFSHMDLMRSDHSRFWYVSRGANETEAPVTMPAVLLTDTGPYRGLMARCYHSACDSTSQLLHNSDDNLAFLAHTTQALVNTLVDLSGARCSGRPLTDPPPPLPSVDNKNK